MKNWIPPGIFFWIIVKRYYKFHRAIFRCIIEERGYVICIELVYVMTADVMQII